MAINYKKDTKRAKEVLREIEKLGRKGWLLKADITQDKQVEDMFQKLGKFCSKLDLLVNCAGFDYGYLIENYTMKQVRYLVDLILVAKILVTKLALPYLKKSSRPAIINIASRTGGPTTMKTVGAYAPAQAGVMKFTQCCALEFARYKIRANCIAPGLTETDLTKNILSAEDFAAAAQKNPSGRVGQPQDVAGVVSFLASPESHYVNGTTILVTGGSELS